MNIGDKRTELPSLNTTFGAIKSTPMEGRVVYIHPAGRFYTVEFTFPLSGEKFRKSYFFEDRA
ncbi:hypothetical protein [uncultured Dysosmobacter sp.]|uniref:hypothetical protein n=1 Tax=uncultured Dysosmobacter sp. TaxID=2591384 RepID=UPI002638A78C|nr:hypothetical protein [uncultured Dysosmobacter sp.]